LYYSRQLLSTARCIVKKVQGAGEGAPCRQHASVRVEALPTNGKGHVSQIRSFHQFTIILKQAVQGILDCLLQYHITLHYGIHSM
jgi:hypothetical protein